MDIHLLSPIESDMMIWTAAGLCALIMFTRKFGWLSIVTSLVSLELLAIGVAVPFLMLRMAPEAAYRLTAVALGFAGTFVVGALVKLLENLRDDPQGTVTWLWAFWKGKGGAQ